MGRPAWTASARVVVSVAACAVVGVSLALVAFATQSQLARTQVERDVRADAVVAVTQVDAALRSALSAASTGAGDGAVTVPASELAGSGADAEAMIEARDTGTPVLDDQARPPAVVVAQFGPGPTASTEQRRAAVTGFRLVPLALQSVLTSAAPSDGGISVRGPDQEVATGPLHRPAGATGFSAAADATTAPGWSVEVWRPAAGTPGAAWLWAAGLLALSAGLGTWLVLLARRTEADDVRQAQLTRDLRLVSGIAPVVQASLDLADVLPATVAHLSDSLGLAGVSISAVSEGSERPIFSWGATPDPAVVPVAGHPADLGPGQTLAVPLVRGGRTLGSLRIVAGEPLVASDVNALVTASELVGSTLANSESFAQQRALVQRMRSVDELKTVFLATASHELRTPVVSIVGFSSLLLEEWATIEADQRQLFMERIVHNAKALDALIEDLLDFSRLERGVQPVGDDLLDLGDTVRRMLFDHPDLLVDHRLESQLASGCTVRGSTSAVERILTNLVGNAAKYSPAGTVVRVSVRSEGDRVVLDVDDEGPGVRPDDRDQIFSRFYRGQGDEVVRTRGAGIGLAIVAEFAASMSGTAVVTDAPSGGARFRVSFPAAAPADVHHLEGGAHVPVP